MNNIYEVSYVYTSNDLNKTRYNCVDTVRASSKERALELVNCYKRRNSCENFSVTCVGPDNHLGEVILIHNVDPIKSNN